MTVLTICRVRIVVVVVAAAVVLLVMMVSMVVHWRRTMRGHVVSAFDSEIRIIELGLVESLTACLAILVHVHNSALLFCVGGAWYELACV